MNIYQSVREAVSTREAAERYGLKVHRNGMCKCPFHNDHTPSMKVDKRFHCFSCQADGDVINFTARLFSIGNREAAMRLAADFGIAYDTKAPTTTNRLPRMPTENEKQNYLIWACYDDLMDYRNLLKTLIEEYAPKSRTDEWHPLFINALGELENVEYRLELLLSGDIEEKLLTVQEWKEKKEERAMTIEPKTPVYRHDIVYAHEHNEIDLYRKSHWANIGCKQAIEKAIAENFDGMYLNEDVAKGVLDTFGVERVAMVLANTLQVKNWDGRFSKSNKEWAFTISMPESIQIGTSNQRDDYVVASHPAVLDGFVQLARNEIREREKPSILKALQECEVRGIKSSPKKDNLER